MPDDRLNGDPDAPDDDDEIAVDWDEMAGFPLEGEDDDEDEDAG